ncbi:MAG: LysM domain-containing protein, partial [Planctomycetia bacterium]|nr:LysM domain-containing protein [Planctomycetia bacterium]
ITLTVSDLAKVARNQNDLQEQPLVVGRTYTVQPDDTFYGIAARLYGDSSKARLLILKNQHLVSNPRRLRVGQKILLLDEVRLARATVAGGLRP